MHARTALCDVRINRKNPAGELGQDERIEPCSQHRALTGIFPFELSYADLQLEDGDGG